MSNNDMDLIEQEEIILNLLSYQSLKPSELSALTKLSAFVIRRILRDLTQRGIIDFKADLNDLRSKIYFIVGDSL